MIRGKLKVILVVTRHSSKFCTRFGHVQVERDFGSAPCAFFFAQLKPFFKKGATGCHALDRTPAQDCNSQDGSYDGRSESDFRGQISTQKIELETSKINSMK